MATTGSQDPIGGMDKTKKLVEERVFTTLISFTRLTKDGTRRCNTTIMITTQRFSGTSANVQKF